MSNTKKTVISEVSNNSIIIKNIPVLSFIDFQFEIIAIGIIIVVNRTKYIDIPSIPKYIS